LLYQRFVQGDHLSQLLKIDHQGTKSQDFACLSLVNDNNRLLDHLIYLLFKHLNQDWHGVSSNGYGVNAWDIEPSCQIAGICDIENAFEVGRVKKASNYLFSSYLSSRMCLFGCSLVFIVNLMEYLSGKPFFLTLLE
jgi:hypothetical protein